MLQQILNDMYIDPELLAELDEEQKQILFCKMREEQVRRWRLREEQMEMEDTNRKSTTNNSTTNNSSSKNIQAKKSSGKKVTFLVGVDGEPVVVVMGGAGAAGGDEVDQLLQERARREADLESDILKRAAEEELDKLVRLSRSTVEAMEEEATRNTSKERDPAREAVVRSLQEATVEMEDQIQALEEAESRQQQQQQQQKRLSSSPSLTITTTATTTTTTSDDSGSVVGGRRSDGDSSSSSSRPSSGSTSPSSGIGSYKSALLSSSPSSSLSSLSSTSSSSNSSSLPPSPPAFSISSYGGNNYNLVTKKLSGLSMWEVSGKSRPSTLTTNPTPQAAHTCKQKQQQQHTGIISLTPCIVSSTVSAFPSSSSSSTSTSSCLSPHASPASPPTSPRCPSRVPLTIVDKEEVKNQLSSSPSSVMGVAAQIRRFEQLSEGSLEALKTATLERARRRRQKEILEHLRSQVEAAQQLTLDIPSEGDHRAWQEQERKAKEAERRIREIARRAREEHRRTAQSTPPTTPPVQSPTSPNGHLLSFPQCPPPTSTHANNANMNDYSTSHQSTLINGDINGNIKPVSEDVSNNNLRGCVRQRVRPPKPPSRSAIVTWFREEELPKGAGLDPTRSHIAPWFHGIISRTEAEEVLSSAGVGCFLVRVSERIWGYAISYRGHDRCRHYLIDVTGGRYTFFGSHQAAHASLRDLVEYHKHEVITVTGGELLTRPCGQPRPLSPDYLELFSGTPYLPT